ncbi:hypothetical protein B0H13DRAFT_1876254 [Mycena leptocephala]|nr:hypothetical protein B0H13DRAFT_1876254 [Mycena leptocephala]
MASTLDQPTVIRLELQAKDIRLYALMVEMFLYGAYTVMFGFYLNVLRTRGISGNRFIAISTIALFILCTLHCIFLLLGTVFGNTETDHIAAELGVDARFYYYIIFYRAANAVYVTSKASFSVVADSIFIFRCYAIWNFRRRVVIIPAIFTVAVAGLGYANVTISIGTYGAANAAFTFPAFLFDISIATSVITTFILMGLSAGRIWWLAHNAQELMGRKVTSKYYTVCAMILESGALYCAGGIPFAVIAFYTFINPTLSTFTAAFDITPTGAILGQLVGIAPTIIAVRVGLGKSIDSVDSFSLTATRPPARHPLEFQPTASATNSIEDRVLSLRPESEQDCATKAEPREFESVWRFQQE